MHLFIYIIIVVIIITIFIIVVLILEYVINEFPALNVFYNEYSSTEINATSFAFIRMP